MTRKILLQIFIVFTFLVFPFLISVKSTNAFFWLFQRKTGDKYVATGSFSDALFEKMKKQAEEYLEKTAQKELAVHPGGRLTVKKLTIEPVGVNQLTLQVSETGEITGKGEIGHLKYKTEVWVQAEGEGGGGGIESDHYYWFSFSGRASGDQLKGELGTTLASYSYKTGEEISRSSYPKGPWTAKKKDDIITGVIKGIEAIDLSFTVTIGEITEVEVTPEPTITGTSIKTVTLKPEEKKKVSRHKLTTRIRSANYAGQVILTGKKEMTPEQKAEFVKDVLGIDPRDFDKNMGQGKKAYIIYSESIDSYRKTWLESITKQTVAAQVLLESLGYQVEIVSPKNSDESFDYMVNPEATAIVNFAHQHYCSIEEVTPDDLPDQIKQATYRYYQKKYDKRTASEKTKQTNTSSLNKDLFINFSCHSLDDPSIINNTIRPGGAYYGHKGILFPTEDLEERMRP